MNKERLIELLEIPYTQLYENKAFQAELTEYYKFIYDIKICTSCKNKFHTYYQKLMVDGLDKLTEKTSNFKLRNDIGVLTIKFENGESISQLSAEDTVCIEFLKANPKRISMFQKYPENWMELIQNNENENANE
jgi:hypothetical protein